MSTIEEQIEAIEKELRETPHHKATDHHIGRLRAKIARLKDRQFESASKKSGGGVGYAVKKQGDATVVLVGPPSVGKSTLINKLTNANSKVAPYAFTTVSVIPGMMQYKETYIQILDVPGLIEGAAEGKGRGREVLSVVRGSDLLVIMTDPENIHLLDTITVSLERNGIRINKQPPDVRIEKKISGGLLVHSNLRQDLDKQTIKEVANEFGFKNAEITIREKLTMERLVDAFARNRVYVPALYVINKVDQYKSQNSNFKSQNLKPLIISAETGFGLDDFKEKMWERLGFVRVYLVKPDEEPHKNSPMIMRREERIKDVAEKIGSEFAETKTRAKIWGTGAKFPGQEISLAKQLEEGMMIRFV